MSRLVDARATLLLVLYALVTIVAPLLLGHGRAISRRPRVVLAAWHSCLITATLSLTLALGLMISAGISLQTAPASSLAGRGWLAPIASTLLAWGATAVLGGLVFRMVDEARRVLSEQKERGRELSRLIAASTPEMIGGRQVLLVRSPLALAAALPSASTILVSTGIRERLAADQLIAVLEHEAAHIRHHHATAVTVARISQSIIPALPAPARLSQATSIVVELIADDAAARRCGRQTVAGALAAFGSPDESMAMRSLRLLSQSTPRLRTEWLGSALWYLLPLAPIVLALLR
jgi:Zn-dependent protease with chaperone function